MSVRNMELKTTSMLVKDATASLTVGGQVPAGMKRWITFLSVDNAAVSASSVALYFASVGVSNPSVASCVATGNRKLLLSLRASLLSSVHKNFKQVPLKPNVNTPLFSIDAGKWCGVSSTGATGNLFVQYYDE